MAECGVLLNWLYGEHDRFITVKGDAFFAYTSKACFIENIVEIIIVVGKVIFTHTGCIRAKAHNNPIFSGNQIISLVPLQETNLNDVRADYFIVVGMMEKDGRGGCDRNREGGREEWKKREREKGSLEDRQIFQRRNK